LFLSLSCYYYTHTHKCWYHIIIHNNNIYYIIIKTENTTATMIIIEWVCVCVRAVTTQSHAYNEYARAWLRAAKQWPIIKRSPLSITLAGCGGGDQSARARPLRNERPTGLARWPTIIVRSDASRVPRVAIRRAHDTPLTATDTPRRVRTDDGRNGQIDK